MARRLRYYFAMGAIMVFILAPFVVDAKPVSACPSGMVYAKVDDETIRCCYDITCLPGHEPAVCSEDSPTSKCIPCSNGTFQPSKSQLSHPQWMKCRQKTNCNVHGTKYRNIGNASIDSTCKCIPGYFCDNGQCLPKDRCRVGYGRDAKTENCQPCALGETYSDVEDVGEPCKRVTRCESSNLCTLKPATVQYDSVCGNYTADCGREEESPIPPVKDVVIVTKDRAPSPLNETQKNSRNQPVGPILITVPSPTPRTFISSDNHISEQHGLTRTVVIGVGIVSVITIVALAIVGVVVFKCKVIIKKHREQLQKTRELEAIKHLDSRYSNAEIQEADFEIFKDALERTSASYAKLGKELLGENKLKTIEEDCKDKNYKGIDMIHEILDEWKEQTGHGEESKMLPDLYGALKRAKMYDTICLIAEKILIGSNQSNYSEAPLMGKGTASSHSNPTPTDECF